MTGPLALIIVKNLYWILLQPNVSASDDIHEEKAVVGEKYGYQDSAKNSDLDPLSEGLGTAESPERDRLRKRRSKLLGFELDVYGNHEEDVNPHSFEKGLENLSSSEFESRLYNIDALLLGEQNYVLAEDVNPSSYEDTLENSPSSELDLWLYKIEDCRQQRLTEDDQLMYDASLNFKRKYRNTERTKKLIRHGNLSFKRDDIHEIYRKNDGDEQFLSVQSGGRMTFHDISRRLSFPETQGHSIKSQSISCSNLKDRLGPTTETKSVEIAYPLVEKPKELKGKFIKRSRDYSRAYLHMKEDEPFEGMPAETEPPEDSDGFKLLVQRNFFECVKMMNENPAQQKKYMVQGKDSSLKCIVCGRNAFL